MTVSASQDGAQVEAAAAEPVAGSPGTFRVSRLLIPSAGDWQVELSLRQGNSDPVSDTTVIPIEAPSSN
ncbi:MAG: hypothetical protein ACRDLZ_01220 [Gaiellaceae bacterium]